MYTTTKRALSLRIRKNASAPEWAGARIALNAVTPGVIRTPDDGIWVQFAGGT